MNNLNKQLTEEIRGVKRNSFPELRWVYVRGVYVPDEEYKKLFPESFGRLKGKLLQIEELMVGFTTISIPYCFSKDDNTCVRRGCNCS